MSNEMKPKKQKRKFHVYLTVTAGTVIKDVEAYDEEEAEAIVENRWTTGAGGSIEYEDLEATDVQFVACEENE